MQTRSKGKLLRISEDMDMIKSIFTPLLKENSMKHIDYKTFNSIQTVEDNRVETRYGELQSRVASLVREIEEMMFIFPNLCICSFPPMTSLRC